mmetsp:Transcript_21614/g.42997  ORF Transcript_21614/g.42997 Transcript_21614/m.42997 type:complete len:81 (-) Transcript_21614:763-1005(-)
MRSRQSEATNRQTKETKAPILEKVWASVHPGALSVPALPFCVSTPFSPRRSVGVGRVVVCLDLSDGGYSSEEIPTLNGPL